MDNLFFNRIGRKIKTLAKILFIFNGIAFVFSGILIIVLGILEEAAVLVMVGFCLIAIGPIIAWISSWFLYGFGEIIDKLCDISENTERPRMIKTVDGNAANAGSDSFNSF